MSNPIERSKIALQYVKDNLYDCCKELDILNQSAILVNGHVRVLTEICGYASSSAQSLAFEMIKQEAVQFVLRNLNE